MEARFLDFPGVCFKKRSPPVEVNGAPASIFDPSACWMAYDAIPRMKLVRDSERAATVDELVLRSVSLRRAGERLLREAEELRKRCDQQRKEEPERRLE
jgi:hypothetical protein